MASNDGVTFQQMLTGAKFYYGAELVSTRGFTGAASAHPLIGMAKTLLDDARIGWISITDNPGGGPMLPPDWLARQLAERRDRLVIHLTCKDMNRSAQEAAAWRYAAEGYRNLLALTGDYPTGGYGGVADPVFDLDSVGLIALLRSMNQGLRVPSRKGGTESLQKTDFYIGCAVSPFKRHEHELVPQYYKLLRKLRTGAHWVIPQLGYDMQKFHEIKLFLTARDFGHVPVIGNVYLLNRAVAKLFNSGKLAGCVVSNELMNVIERYAAGPDKGKTYFRELAAKQLAVFKGLGFQAGYLGGIGKADGFFEIIDLAESYKADDWRDFIKEIHYPQPDEFYFFRHDPVTHLSSPDQINPQFLASLKSPPKPKDVTLGYRFSRMVHSLAFNRGKGLYNMMTKIFGRFDKKPGFMSRFAYWLERESKHLGFGCKDCGDCSLPDCAYICPMASCSKHSRNGPCGGSANGECELADKDCFWARVYRRLKYYGQSEEMLSGPVVIYDSKLKATSAWANTYLDRDHAGTQAAAQANDPEGKLAAAAPAAASAPAAKKPDPSAAPPAREPSADAPKTPPSSS